MGQPYFHFKKFSVRQEFCAQKVGTLSCMLGAMARHPLPLKILDIGTGTGLLALMMAQKFPTASIDAIEIDHETAIEARQNFLNSPWNSNLHLINQDILDFNPLDYYDLIISNPPFYKGHLHSINDRVNLARHSLALHYLQLVPWICRYLGQQGKCWILLPPLEMDRMASAFKSVGLGVAHMYKIFIRLGSPEKARVVCFSRNVTVARQETFYIHEHSGHYSKPFVELLKNFYLHL